MSFDDWGSGGGSSYGGSRSQGYQRGAQSQGRNGDNQYIRLSQTVKNNILTITQNVGNLQKMVNFLGTARDVPEMHRRLEDVMETTRVLIRDTNASLKQLGQLDGGSPQEARKRKMEQEKLAQDFTAVLRTFQSCQKIAVAKEKETVRQQRAVSFGRDTGGGYDGGYDEDARLIDDNRRREQQQLDMQIDTQSAFIEEREEGIKELESKMLEVNDIFRDLGNLVVEQGEMLDSIEYNMTATSTHVDSGREELGKASRYQKKARNKMMCLLIVVVLVAAVLTIILVTSLPHGSKTTTTTQPPPTNTPK